jgi:hypothetical protein
MEFITAARGEDADAVIDPARRFLDRMTPEQASAVLDATTRAMRTLESATGIQIAKPINERSKPLRP